MPRAEKLKRGTTEAVTSALSKWFYWYGFPEKIRSDFGPCFRNSFTKWCTTKGIRHEVSSGYFAPSNGLAEAGVVRTTKLIKRARECGQSVELALAEYRNTAMATSPALSDLFYNHDCVESSLH